MAGHIETSIGSLDQSGTILMPNPGFPPRGQAAYDVANITFGTDVIAIKHKNESVTEVAVLKNGVQQASPIVDFRWSQVGFANRYVEGTGTVFYYVCCNSSADLGSVIIENPGSPGYAYAALRIGVYDWEDIAVSDVPWDEQPSSDPYGDPGNTNIRGGEAANTMPYDTTDNIYDFPSASPWDYDISKLCTLYCFDSSQLADLGTALFDNDFWTQLKNKFTGLSDPLSMILSVYQLPVLATGSADTFKLGGIPLESSLGSPISCKKITYRYITLNFGSINLKEVWGTAKDYTDASVAIFLPFCGEKELDPDIVVGATVTLNAQLDVWTGDVVYLMKIQKTTGQNYFPIQAIPYRWTGNCAKKFPIGRIDTSAAVMGLISSGISIVGGAALGIATGNPAGLIAGAAGAANLLGTGMRPSVQSSGNVSGAPGYMDITYPYLMIKRGIPQYPTDWREHIGAPRYQSFLVASLSGYTEFADIHADNVPDATDTEKLMIENQMKAGIFI